MLFYLFVTLQIIYSVSCDISCHQAPFDTNSFDYTVTADHFPAELRNSSLKANAASCYILVLWQRNPDNTKIALIPAIGIKAEPTEHQLQVDVGYQTKLSPTPTWAKQIVYQCNTDRCNSLSQLKLLLSKLMVNESLHELLYLLNPVKPFHGEWCYRGSNTTSEQCNTTIPVSSCTQCEFMGMATPAGTESCGMCSTGDPDNSLLVYQKTFNMADRTNSSTWEILCGRESCNTPAIGESIRQKSYIYFDFTEFLSTEAAA